MTESAEMDTGTRLIDQDPEHWQKSQQEERGERVMVA